MTVFIEMKKIILLSIISLNLIPVFAQTEKVNHNFYGFVRSDFHYNSRINKEGSEGLSVAYPLGKDNDFYGRDLNALPQSGMQSIGTRMGIDFNTNSLGAEATAKYNAILMEQVGIIQ